LQADPVAFGRSVSAFLVSDPFMTPANHFVQPWALKRHVILEDGLVKHSRIMLQYDSDLRVQARYIDNFKEQHKLVFPDGSDKPPRVPNTFEYSEIMRDAQRDEVMKVLIFKSLGFACAAVCAVVCIMLNVPTGMFVGALVVSIDVLLVAMMSLYGLKLDIGAFMCLAMTVGLTVDYPCHTTHAYLALSESSPSERLRHAVSSTGASVISGGGSTILGISVLAFASSKAFRAFFWTFSTAIVLGIIIGVLVGPVLLSLFHGFFNAIRSRCCKCKSSKGEQMQIVEEECKPTKESSPEFELNPPQPVLLGSRDQRKKPLDFSVPPENSSMSL
jgi:hypothetical protein